MAEVVLFHSVVGQTPGFLAFADDIRGGGHTVHAPDLFDGRTFPGPAQGMAYAEAVGLEHIIELGVKAASALAPEVVYAGISMGVLSAQKLAQTRVGARGALLLESCLPATYFGESWLTGVPVQIHGMDHDPFFAGEGDIDNARALVASADEAELFVYAGDKHLFTDSSLPTYDAQAAELLLSRVLAFLSAR